MNASTSGLTKYDRLLAEKVISATEFAESALGELLRLGDPFTMVRQLLRMPELHRMAIQRQLIKIKQDRFEWQPAVFGTGYTLAQRRRNRRLLENLATLLESLPFEARGRSGKSLLFSKGGRSRSLRASPRHFSAFLGLRRSDGQPRHSLSPFAPARP
jgi:hypothetical protein